MHENDTPEILMQATAEVQPSILPSVEFVYDMHYSVVVNEDGSHHVEDRYAVELGHYDGMSALSRPLLTQQSTVAAEFYRLHRKNVYKDPKQYMELNRTIMNVWLYDLVRKAETEEQLITAHEAFTACQHESDKMTLDQFRDLKSKCDEVITTPEEQELFTASLIYADLGKSASVLEFMQEYTGRQYADHDRLLHDIMNDPVAIQKCMPSFLRFTPEQQETIKGMMKLHLPQFMQAEILPAHLVEIQAQPEFVQKLSMLSGLFDVGGAAGDKIQNGSITINGATYRNFQLAWDALLSKPQNNPNPTAKEQAIHSYKKYLHDRISPYGDYDIDQPRDYLLSRVICMFRNPTAEQVSYMEQAYDSALGANTVALLDRLFSHTGFETQEEGGSLWIQYQPDLFMMVFSKMCASKVNPVKAMGMAFTFMARLSVQTRNAVAMTGITTVAAGNIVREIDETNDWSKLIQDEIMLLPIRDAEVAAHFRRVPSIFTGAGSAALREVSKDELQVQGRSLIVKPPGDTQRDFERLMRSIHPESDPSFVTLQQNIPEHAERLSRRVYALRPAMLSFSGEQLTNIPPHYLIKDTDQSAEDLQADFAVIAEHTESIDNNPSSVTLVTVGGTFLQPEASASTREAKLLQGSHHLEQLLGRSQPDMLGRAMLLLPGMGGPTELPNIITDLQGTTYDLWAHRSVLPGKQSTQGSTSTSDYDPKLSDALHALSFVLQDQTIKHGQGVEPLPAQTTDVLRLHKPRVPYTVTNNDMRHAVITDLARLAEHVGSS